MPAVPPPASHRRRWSPLWVGSAWVLLAALGYTASNVFLRRTAVTTDPWWACAVRATPIMVLALVGMAWQARRGRAVWPTAGLWGPLIWAGLSSQIFGNVAFQHSLGVVGLALTVPLTFSTILVGGAILGRLWLHEPITLRAVLSMGLLSTAIAVLSLGAGEAGRSVLPAAELDPWTVGWALAAGCGSGIAYAATGVVIRKSVVAKVPLATVQFFISVSGVVVLGAWSAGQSGLAHLAATPRETLADLLGAGLLNYAAFYCFGEGLRRISVVHANALNSTQIALAALAGVAFFGEAPSAALVLGLMLTVVGLALMQSAMATRPGASPQSAPVASPTRRPREARPAALQPALVELPDGAAALVEETVA